MGLGSSREFVISDAEGRTLRIGESGLVVDKVTPPMVWTVLKSSPHPPPVNHDAYVLGHRGANQVETDRDGKRIVTRDDRGTPYWIQGDSERGWSIAGVRFADNICWRQFWTVEGPDGAVVLDAGEETNPMLWKFTPVPE